MYTTSFREEREEITTTTTMTSPAPSSTRSLFDPLTDEPLVSVDFEVFGKVQGCSFTKYVRELCQRLGIVGWVKNSRSGTILGKMQGPQALVDQMAEWLSTKGSPDSEIHHCEFKDLCSVTKPGYKGFQVRF